VKVHNGVQQESLLKDSGFPVSANDKIVIREVVCCLWLRLLRQ